MLRVEVDGQQDGQLRVLDRSGEVVRQRLLGVGLTPLFLDRGIGLQFSVGSELSLFLGIKDVFETLEGFVHRVDVDMPLDQELLPESVARPSAELLVEPRPVRVLNVDARPPLAHGGEHTQGAPGLLEASSSSVVVQGPGRWSGANRGRYHGLRTRVTAGHVFTANMTGNVVLLGFAAGGAPGFSVAASLASLGCFLVGAVCAGRMCLYVRSHRR